MGAVGESFLQMQQSRNQRMAAETQRLELPFVRQQQQSELDYKAALTRHQNALSATEEQLRQFKVGLEQANMDKAQDEVEMLGATKEGRMAMAKITEATNQHILDIAKNDPQKFQAWATAAQRMEATKADAADLAIQDEREWRILDEAHSAFTRGGVQAVQQILPGLNTKWQAATGTPLHQGPLTKPVVAAMIAKRKDLIYTRELWQEIIKAQSSPTAGLAGARYNLSVQRMNSQLEKQTQDRADKMAKEERVAFETDSKGIDRAVGDALIRQVGALQGADKANRYFVAGTGGVPQAAATGYKALQESVANNVRLIRSKLPPGVLDYRTLTADIVSQLKVIPSSEFDDVNIVVPVNTDDTSIVDQQIEAAGGDDLSPVDRQAISDHYTAALVQNVLKNTKKEKYLTTKLQ